MYQQHELSAAWPAMSDSDFQALEDSITNIGVQMPIVIFEGKVIDGWNRYRAATALGMDCPSIPFDESIDPVEFVKAMNDARRHITGSQRAIAIVALHAWRPVGKPKANVEVTSTLSQQAMADEAGVSKKTIQHAQAAQKAGLSDKVKSGEMTVEQAANVAKGKPAKPAPKPKPEPAAPAAEVEPEAEAPPEYTELDAARDQITELQSELVVARMGDIPEDQKTQAAERIAALQAEVNTLTATLKAVQLSRDSLMEEAVQMKRQMKAQREEIARLKAKN